MIDSVTSFIRAIGLSHREILAHKKKYLKEIISFMFLGMVTFLLSLYSADYSIDIYIKVLSFFLEFVASLFILRIYLIDKNSYLKIQKKSLDVLYYIFRYLKSVVVVWGAIMIFIGCVLLLLSLFDLSTTVYIVVGVLLMAIIAPIFNLAPEIVILLDTSIWEAMKKSFNIVKDNIVLVWFRSAFGIIFYVLPLLYTFIANQSYIGFAIAGMMAIGTFYLDILYNRTSVKMVFNLAAPETETDLV